MEFNLCLHNRFSITPGFFVPSLQNYTCKMHSSWCKTLWFVLERSYALKVKGCMGLPTGRHFPSLVPRPFQRTREGLARESRNVSWRHKSTFCKRSALIAWARFKSTFSCAYAGCAYAATGPDYNFFSCTTVLNAVHFRRTERTDLLAHVKLLNCVAASDRSARLNDSQLY